MTRILPAALVLVAIASRLPAQAPSASPGAPVDTQRVKTYLAGMLGMRSTPATFLFTTAQFPAFQSVQFFVGHVPGAHGSQEEAFVAAVPELGLVPLGCEATARLLASRMPSPLRRSDALQYARDLAVLSGQLPSSATIVRDLSALPAWVMAEAQARRLEVRASGVVDEGATIRVTLLAFGPALWEVTVVLGEDPARDTVLPGRLLIGNPSG